MNPIDMLLKTCGTLLSPRGRRAALSVLIYHRVLEAPDPLVQDSVAAGFDLQMRTLKEHFNVLPLADALAALQDGSLPARAAAITFDDGYADNLLVAAPILRRHGLPATFFIATGYLNGGRMFNDSVIETIRRMRGQELDIAGERPLRIRLDSDARQREAISALLRSIKYLPIAERSAFVDRLAQRADSPLPRDLMMTDEQVSQLAKLGMQIGGHTTNHPILCGLDTAAAVREIESNRDALHAITGRLPVMFAYPNGRPDVDYDARHMELVRAAGYAGSVTTSWGVARNGDDLYQVPRFTPWHSEPRRFMAQMLRNLLRRPVLAAPRARPAA